MGGEEEVHEERPGVHGVSSASWPCLCVVFVTNTTHKKSHDLKGLLIPCTPALLRALPKEKRGEKEAGGSARSKWDVVTLPVCCLRAEHNAQEEPRLYSFPLTRAQQPPLLFR